MYLIFFFGRRMYLKFSLDERKVLLLLFLIQYESRVLLNVRKNFGKESERKCKQ